MGTIQRPNAQERQFEVASHRWIDLTDQSGGFGATILTEYKNGSDKPNDHTIRLTLLRSPGMQPPTNGRPQGYSDQANQDWGHHEFVFGLAGHAGTWEQAQTDWQAYRLSDPLIAFQTTEHSGPLGKTFSLLQLDNSRIRVLALKKAEADDEIILRMVELDGHPAHDVRVSFAGPIVAAREVNAQEQQEQEQQDVASLNSGALVTSFTAYQPRTYALRLGPPTAKLAAVRSQPVALNYDLAAASNDDTRTPGGGFDGKGNAIAGRNATCCHRLSTASSSSWRPPKPEHPMPWLPRVRPFLSRPDNTIGFTFWPLPRMETKPRHSVRAPRQRI